MFLRELSEDEQKVFLNLAYTLMNVNGEITKEEEATFFNYQGELRVDLSKAQVVDFAKEVSLLSDAPLSKKKKIFFELLAMAMADHEYDEHERRLMRTMQDKFGISDEVAIKIEEVIQKIVDVYRELNCIVSE